MNALHNDAFNHDLMMDEGNFYLCGNFNSQNCRYRTTINPRDTHQKTLCSEKVIVWCGVASFRVIGLYFYEDKTGRAVTVNSTHYTETLHTFLEPKMRRLGVEMQTHWFHQDGATAHNVSPLRVIPTSCDLMKREY